MKKQTNNICKFITSSKYEQILTTNFVYETDAENFASHSLQKNNAMYLVVSGNGQLCTEHFKKELLPGMLFFTFSGNSYKIENAEDLKYMYITFNGERSKELFSRFNISLANCIFKGYEGLSCFWQNCLEKANPQNLDLISESVLLYSFASMPLMSESKEQHLISNILKYIEENFTSNTLSLNSMADELNYNSKYISKIFKENIGVTFSEYIKSTRIKHAIFLMEQGITSIQNVALLSGYSDPFYFSNVFKQTIGISPSEFINNKKRQDIPPA